MSLEVEYDGVQYHKDVEKDNCCSMVVIDSGNNVIRIREHGLSILEGTETIFLESVNFKTLPKPQRCF